MLKGILLVFAIINILSTLAAAAINFQEPGINLFMTSPRIIAMGGARVAVADDANAVFLNPAGLGSFKQSEIVANYGCFSEDANQYTLTGCFSANGYGGFGLGYDRFGVYNIPTTPGPINYFVETYTIAYGLEAYKGFDLGVKINRYSEQYTNFLGLVDGYGLSASILYRPLQQLRLGALIENLLGSWSGTRIPPDALFGLAWQYKNNFPLIAADIGLVNLGAQQELNSLSLGIEYGCFGNSRIRAGYSASKINNYQASGAAGFGISLPGNWQLNYAIQHIGAQTIFSHYFSLGCKF